MTAKVYYNEYDPFAAKWLKELINKGHLPDGDVDSRSIKDVRATDLFGYQQCHFFAGIGGWPLALKQAGWGDRPVWTGSCPCQPFSDAGKQKGFDDDRHLWPVFYNLIRHRQPNAVLGEQVASKIALAWLDDVQTDLEREDYAFSSVDLCASGYGAPHIRQRLFWVANANGGNPGTEWQQHGGGHLQRTEDTVDGEWLANTESGGRWEERPDTGGMRTGVNSQGDVPRGSLSGGGAGGLVHPKSIGRSVCDTEDNGAPNAQSSLFADPSDLSANGQQQSSTKHPCPTNSFWQDADWLRCRDDKWRPVEPCTFPLVNGISPGMGRSGSGNRLQRLKGYGNAIVVPLAVEFIQACMSI